MNFWDRKNWRRFVRPLGIVHLFSSGQK